MVTVASTGSKYAITTHNDADGELFGAENGGCDRSASREETERIEYEQD